jgi:CHRD domain
VKKPALLTGGAVICVLALIVPAAATARTQATSIRVTADMDAAQEVPAPRGDVDNARGTFNATVTKSGSGASIRWTLNFAGLTGPAVAAHIHTGREGDAGGIAVTLCGPCTNPENGTENLTAAQLTAIQNGGMYVNIHTAMNAAGEIRGQIAVTANFTAKMGPRQTVPRAKGRVGRARGTLRGTVTRQGTLAELTWQLNFSRLTGRARSAHIHIAPRGSRGRIALTLCGPCRNGVKRTVTIRGGLLTALEQGFAYVDVHTRRNKAGEIRGQIARLPLSIS